MSKAVKVVERTLGRSMVACFGEEAIETNGLPVRPKGSQLLTQVSSTLLSINALHIVRTHNNRMLCMYILTITSSQYFVCTRNFTCFISAVQACN